MLIFLNCLSTKCNKKVVKYSNRCNAQIETLQQVSSASKVSMNLYSYYDLVYKPRILHCNNCHACTIDTMESVNINVNHIHLENLLALQ